MVRKYNKGCRLNIPNSKFNLQEDIVMNKNTFDTVKLEKGEMNIYDFWRG